MVWLQGAYLYGLHPAPSNAPPVTIPSVSQYTHAKVTCPLWQPFLMNVRQASKSCADNSTWSIPPDAIQIRSDMAPTAATAQQEPHEP